MIDFILSVESGIERQETVRVFHAPPLLGGLCCLEISEQVNPKMTAHHGVRLNKAEARRIAERLMEYVNS